MAKSQDFELHIVVNSADDSGWTVDVIRDGESVLRNVHVTDPLTLEQRLTCQWYMEQYVQYAPFSGDKALETEALLEGYPLKLLGCLPLRDILQTEPEISGTDPMCLYIHIHQDPNNCSGASIHQIFWETLENPDLWPPNLRVIVQRSVSDDAENSITRSDHVTPWSSSNGTLTINLLLVVARDLDLHTSTYEDVSPTLAISGILKAQAKLRERKAPVQLLLEIVRPGTLAALQEYLQRTEARHGPGYFHIIHFDMHGRVAPRKQSLKKLGILYFSRPNSHNTMAVPTQLVCKVVNKYKIPFVVLNACDSASSSSGDEANMARQFLIGGARNVAGMSFKVANSAATIFVEAFYQAFLLDGQSFAASAAAGRMALRVNISRPTRYGLQRNLRDSFVAVTYGQGQSISVSDIPKGWPGPTVPAADEPAAEENIPRHSDIAPKHVGREFDLLRLEALISQNPVTYLSGLAGVGKTAFLEFAASIWKKTQFVDAIVSIDLQFSHHLSGREISIAIMRQVSSQLHSLDHQSHLWNFSSKPLDSYESSEINKMITDIVAKIDCVIIIEGLEIASLDPLPETLHTSETKEAIPLFKSLLSIAEDNSRAARCHLIFTQRRANPRVVEMILEYDIGPYCYELRGLDFADAIELSQQVLEASGEDVRQWKHEDVELLDCIIELLRAIPLALITILPLQQKLKIPWRLFFNRLHSGLFTSSQSLKESIGSPSSFVADFERLSILLPGQFFLLSLLSMYWHEAPDLYRLLPTFNAVATDSFKRDIYHRGLENVKFMLQIFEGFVFDRGYVRRGPTKDTLEIHPLFTIVGQASLMEVITIAKRVTLRTLFGASQEALVTDTLASSITDNNIPAKIRHYRESFANYLTVMKFCTQEVPAENWPLAFLWVCNDHALANQSRSVKLVLYDAQFKLLETMTYKFPLIEEKERHFILLCVGLLTLTWMSELLTEPIQERILSLSNKGNNLLSQLGIPKHDETFTTCQAILLYISCHCLFRLGRKDELTRKMLTWASIKTAFEIPQAREIRSCIAAAGAAGRLAQDEAIRMTFQLLNESTRSAKDSPLQEYRDRVYIGLLVLEESEAELGRWAHTKLEQLEANMSTIFEEHQIPGTTSPEVDEHYHTFLMSRLLRPSDVPQIPLGEPSIAKGDLNEIEEMYESNSWVDLCEEHLEMAAKSFQKDGFHGGMQHLESIQAILDKASVPQSLLEGLRDCKLRVHRAFMSYSRRIAIYPPRYFDRGYKSDVEERSEAIRSTATADQSRLEVSSRAKWPTKAEEEEFSRAPMKWWVWLQGFLGQDPGWVTCISENEHQYPEEASIMYEMHAEASQNNHEKTLSLLDRMQVLCNHLLFVTYPITACPLQAVRSALEVAVEQKRLGTTIMDLARHDFDAARLMIEHLAAGCMPKFCSWITDATIEGFQLAVDKYQFAHFQMSILDAAFDTEKGRMEKLCREFMLLVDSGPFSRFDSEVVRPVRTAALVWLNSHVAASSS